MHWDVYRRTVAGGLKEIYHSPYFFTLHPIIAKIAKFISAKPEWHELGRVDFFLDDQIRRIERDARAFQFYNVKETAHEQYERAMGEIAFRNDELNYSSAGRRLDRLASSSKKLNLPEDLGRERHEYKRLRNASAGGKLMKMSRRSN